MSTAVQAADRRAERAAIDSAVLTEIRWLTREAPAHTRFPELGVRAFDIRYFRGAARTDGVPNGLEDIRRSLARMRDRGLVKAYRHTSLTEPLRWKAAL